VKVDLADAQLWLQQREGIGAQAVIYDPPYAVGTPVRGKEDGSAGSVYAPFGFLHETLRASRNALKPGGVVFVFSDWRRMHDMAYMASTVGLRPSTMVAWVRTRPGTGGMFRSAWDPILVASRGVPESRDRAAIRNVIEANYPTKRTHPYEKPEEVFTHLLSRLPEGGLILDPFAGSGVSGKAAIDLGFEWEGADIDPTFAIEHVGLYGSKP